MTTKREEERWDTCGEDGKDAVQLGLCYMSAKGHRMHRSNYERSNYSYEVTKKLLKLL